MIIPSMIAEHKAAQSSAVAEKKQESKILDHLGLVMGICKELDIAGIINEAIPNDSPDKILSVGTGVVGMILETSGDFRLIRTWLLEILHVNTIK